MARLGGLAGFGCGVLIDRPNGWIEPNREADLDACEAGLSGWCTLCNKRISKLPLHLK